MNRSDSKEELVTQAAFAKRVGVSRASVGCAIEAGRLSESCVVDSPRGKKLKLEQSLAEWAGLRDESADDGDATNWRIKKLEQDAKLAERRRLDLEREAQVAEGKLCRLEDVEAILVDQVTRTRSLLLAIAASAARPIAAMAKKEMSATELSSVVKSEIEKRIRECLTGLSSDPKQMLKQVVKKRKR